MSRGPLNIDGCWDDNSIDDKIRELENLLMAMIFLRRHPG